ncbi:hypothetical protein GQ457_04G021480 [Hibiscus cannabinus]
MYINESLYVCLCMIQDQKLEEVIEDTKLEQRRRNKGIFFSPFPVVITSTPMLALTLSFACNGGGIVMHVRFDLNAFHRSFVYDAHMIVKW